MKRMLWCTGFTTVEFLGATACAAIVLSALYGFYRQQLFSLLVQETRTVTLEDVRGSLDIMVRELRNAGSFPVMTDATCVKDSSGDPLRVVSASSTSIRIQADTESRNGAEPDGKCKSVRKRAKRSLTISAVPPPRVLGR
jgi:Tfp pilus assembly protein PilW